MPSCRLHAIQTASSHISAYDTSTFQQLSIPLGIFFGLLASFIQSLGLTIQRKSHVLNQLLPEHEQRAEYRRPLWLLGTGIFVSSNVVGSLVQIASLPVVILAPLGAVSLLWNAFFARVILGDVFSPWMILGTIFIAGGAVLIAVFGIVPEPTRSLEDLLLLFSRSAFIIYFSMLGFVVVICLLVTHIAEFSLSRQTIQIKLLIPPSPSNGSTHRLSPLSSEAVIPTERVPLLDPKPIPPSPALSSQTIYYNHDIHKKRLWLAISYASISGILSGMCLLFAKSGVELLLLTLRGQNQFWRWQAWLLLLGLLAFALLQLWYLHKALILADPALVCPSAFCFYNLSSIVNGLVYFDQFSLIPPLHLGLVILGICVLLGGVWVVSTQSGPKSADYESGSESDGESSVQSDVQSISAEGLRVPGLLRASRSESAADELQVVPVESGTIGRDYGTIAAGPSRPSQPQRRRTTQEEASQSREHGTHHRDTLSPHLVPLNTNSTLPGGFSIGLSPVSPGFAIVPTERGRRLSGLGLADVVIEVADRERGRERRRRRTVSEGDVRNRSSLLDDQRDTSEAPTEEHGVEGRQPKAPRQRWKWVKRMFVHR